MIPFVLIMLLLSNGILHKVEHDLFYVVKQFQANNNIRMNLIQLIKPNINKILRMTLEQLE